MEKRGKMPKEAESRPFTVKWMAFNEKIDRIRGHLAMADGREFMFWADRDKKIDFKRHMHEAKIIFVKQQSFKKGYHTIHVEHYELISPKFQDQLEIYLTAHILRNE